MDKFSIVAALQLELDNSIDTAINSVKDRLKGAAAITLSTRGIGARIREIKEKLKESKVALPVSLAGGTNTQIATKLTTKLNSIASLVKKDAPTILMNIAINSRSEENVRSQLKQLATTLAGSSTKSPILLNVGVNPVSEERVNSQVKALKKSLSGAQNMLGGQIKSPQKTIQVPVSNIDINEQNVVANLKRKIANINNALMDSIVRINIQIDNDTHAELRNLVGLLSKIQSKTIRINLGTRESTINKIGLLANQFTTLNTAIASLNLPKLTTTSDVLSYLGNSLKYLSRVSGKNFKFGFEVKDAKILERIHLSTEKMSKGFDAATLSAINFRSVLQSLVTLGQSFNNIGSQFQNNKLPRVNNKSSNNTGNAVGPAITQQNNVTKSVGQTISAMEALGEQSAITFKRFGAYTLVTAGFFRLTFAIQNALTEFKEFELQLNKIRQVTQQSYSTTQGLGDEISRLAVKYGVSSKSIAETSLVLAQAGFTAQQTSEALEALTLSQLSPTFDDITSTVEASIAAISQFDLKTSDLNKTLSQINSVSAAFAVESSDLGTAIQKAGGSFVAAGGSIEELFALFTSVRASTRESADTIATGFRTIFTRLQRLRTSDFLSEFGVNIRKTSEDVDALGGSLGEFIGPFESIKRLSEAMGNIPGGGLDSRFAQIAEELGGFRQINKVLPLLNNFDVAMDAYNVAMKRTDSLNKDAIIAQETYANSITKLKEEFLLLVREFAENKSIKAIITSMIELTRVTLQAAQAFKDLLVPVLPILTLAAVSPTAQVLSGFGRTFSSFTHRNKGGWIPGDGHKDDTPAMLTRGEYVLRKAAVKKIGVKTLDNMNAAKFNKGGYVGGGAGSAAAAFGAYSILQLGGLSEFTKLDNIFKDAGLAVASFAASIYALNRIIPSLTDRLKTNLPAQPVGQKKQYSAFSQYAPNAPGYTPRLLSSKTSNVVLGTYAQNLLGNMKKDAKYISGNVETVIKTKEYNNALRKQNNNLASWVNNPNQTISKAAIDSYRLNNAQMNLNNFRIRQSYAQTNQTPRARMIEANNLGIMEGRNASIDRQRSTMRMQNYLNLTNSPPNDNWRSRFSRMQFSEESINKGAMIAGGAGIALSLAGSVLQRENERRIAAGNGDIGFARAAGALSGAGSGALTGAAAGAILGPQGMIIGAALGGMTGAVRGFIQGGKDFEAALDRMSIKETTKELNDMFTAIKDGKTNARIRSGDFVTGLSSLRSKLQSTSDPDSRQDINAALNNSSLEILNFVKSLAESSGSLQNFNQRIDQESQRFISGILGKSFSEFQDMIQKSIKSGNMLAFSQRLLAQATLDFENQTRAILRFNTAFNEASRSKNVRTTNLSSFIEGGFSGNAIGNSLAESIRDSSNSSNVFDTSARIQSFGRQFGAYGRSLSDTVSSFVKAKNLLPEILLKIKSQDPLGESDVSGTLQKELSDANFSKNIINLISARFDDLSGGDLKDSSFYKNLEKDLGKATSDLLEGGQPAVDAFANAIEKSSEILQTYSDNLLKLIAIDQKILEGKSLTKGLEKTLIESEDTFFSRLPNFNALMQNAEQNSNLFTGGRNSAQLLSAIGASRSNINILDEQIKNTEDNTVRANLIEQKQREIEALNRATIGLDHLAKSTASLSLLQAKLNQLQQDRLRIEDFQNSFIFGSNQDRREQERVVKFAQDAVAANDINVVPDQMRRNVFSLLQQFENQVVPGLSITGKDAINKLRVGAGFAPSGPSAAEAVVQSQIASEIQKMIDAQNGLNTVLEKDRLEFSKGIRQDFDNLIKGLNETINTGFARDLNNQIGGLAAEQRGLQEQKTRLDNANKTFGEKAIVNAAAIKQNELDLSNSTVTSTNAKYVQERVEFLKAGDLKTPIEKGWAGGGRVKLENLATLFNEYTEGVDSITKDLIYSKLITSDLGLKDGLFSQGKFESALKTASEQVENDADTKFASALFNRGQLIDNVGKENFDKILKDVLSKNSELITLSNEFPRDTSVKELATKIGELNQKIEILKKSGQGLPGFGQNSANTPNSRVSQIANSLQPSVSAAQKVRQSNDNDAIPTLQSSLATQASTPNTSVAKPVDAVTNLVNRGIPQSIASSLVESGVSLTTADSLLDIDPSLRFQQPRGQSKSFDSIKGLYRGGTKQIFLRNDAGNEVLSHEVGHAFDYYKNSFSQSKEYLAAYMRDVKSFTEEDKQKYQYYLQKGEGGLRESFAALFDSVLNNTSLKNKFPNSAKLIKKLIEQHKPTGFSSGGFVSGSGNTDSVSARLMPGEFVMRKSAVQKHGIGFMKQINGDGVQRFANGGPVQQNIAISSESIAKLNMVVNQLSIQIENMKSAFAVIPTEIKMTGKHTLDINLNGSTVLQNILPEVRNLILSEIKNSINSLIKKKFPQVGHFE